MCKFRQRTAGMFCQDAGTTAPHVVSVEVSEMRCGERVSFAGSFAKVSLRFCLGGAVIMRRQELTLEVSPSAT
jgi:hypothetical protein